MIRYPAVAGSFYSQDKTQLRSDIEDFVNKDAEKHTVLGIVSPHAGYIYSGRVAGNLYSKIEIPDTVIILSPNHTGVGATYSIWPGGSWRTPLGDVTVDEEVVNELLHVCNLIEKDKEAHLDEYAAEVQIPFIQYFKPSVKIVVMVISSRNITDLKNIGKNLSQVLNKIRPDALVVASSDMTHHETQTSANRKDKIYSKVHEMRITMCGIYPTVIMLVCSKERGAKKAELVRYETSGDITGDYDQVVGYAGIIVI